MHLESGFLSDKRLGKNDIKVLIAIVAHYNWETKVCNPSRARLSKFTGLHASKISAATKNLTDWGYIDKIPSSGKLNNYRLKLLSKSEPVPKRGGVPKQAPTRPQNGTGPLPKTGTQNIPITKKEQTTHRCLSQITYSQFQKSNNQPKYSTEFEAIWKRYKWLCNTNKSMEGSKHLAWFYFLQLKESDFDEDKIMKALEAYAAKKAKASGEKLAHLSTVLNDSELIIQFLEEIDENHLKLNDVGIEGIDG